jgi:hypothetical protein
METNGAGISRKQEDIYVLRDGEREVERHGTPASRPDN